MDPLMSSTTLAGKAPASDVKIVTMRATAALFASHIYQDNARVVWIEENKAVDEESPCDIVPVGVSVTLQQHAMAEDDSYAS